MYDITVKGGKYLEALANADTIVFDKTGTLTHATPTVVQVVPFGTRSHVCVPPPIQFAGRQGFTRQSFPWSGHQSLRRCVQVCEVRLAAGFGFVFVGRRPLLAESDASVLALRSSNKDRR